MDGQTGQVVSYYNPRISPLSLRTEIEAMLSKGAPYEPKEIPAGLGGTSPILDSDMTSFAQSGCAVGDKPKEKPSAEADNKI